MECNHDRFDNLALNVASFHRVDCFFGGWIVSILFHQSARRGVGEGLCNSQWKFSLTFFTFIHHEASEKGKKGSQTERPKISVKAGKGIPKLRMALIHSLILA